jgi:hypothetical protein
MNAKKMRRSDVSGGGEGWRGGGLADLLQVHSESLLAQGTDDERGVSFVPFDELGQQHCEVCTVGIIGN